MSQHELFVTYFTALFGRFRDDERGDMAQTIVITGVSLVAAAAVALLLWSKLKSGANNVEVPAPAAP
jgi:hypothetical protein